jgi:Domain of unknown function (DUF1902)
LSVEFRPIVVSFDADAGLYWVSDSHHPRLVAEARTIGALQRKLAKMLDTEAKHIELRLPARRAAPKNKLRRINASSKNISAGR